MKDLKVITDTVSLGSYQITPIPTHHSKLVRSTVYLVAKGKERVLYTGDIIWIDRECHPLLNGLDLVITDGSYIRKGGLVRKDKITGQLYGHAGIPDLVHLFREFASGILLVHFGSWFYTAIGDARGKLKELRLSSGVKLYVGYDGEELDLAELS